MRYTISLSATRGCPCVDTAVLSVANVVTSDLISNAIGHNSVIVKDINCGTIHPHQLSFSAPFTLRGTTPRRMVARAFILYFDAFFSPTGEQVSPGVSAQAAKDGEVILA